MVKKFLPIILLLIVSSFLVFYQYAQIPQGLTHDENELARVAFSLEGKPYMAFTTIADGHGTPYFYSLLLSFKLFGVNKFALRLPSRIYGILSVIVFYLILEIVYKKQKILNSRLLILASLLLLTSRWYLHFARVSFEMPFLLLAELISLYFSLLFLENKQNKFIILSGLFAGIAFNSYQPGRIFFLVPIVMFLMKKIDKRRIFYFLITFLIIILPMSYYLLTHPGNDIRIDQQFFLKNGQLSVAQKAEFLWSNISSTALMFFTKGDINGTHNYTSKPALNPILGVFFLIGLIISLYKHKNFYNRLFLGYFFISIVPTILTYPWENPNMLRTYTTLPAIIYFVFLTFITIYELIKKRYAKYLFIFFLLTSVLYLLSSGYELRTYFKYQPLVFKQSFDKPDYLPIVRKDALKQP